MTSLDDDDIIVCLISGGEVFPYIVFHFFSIGYRKKKENTIETMAAGGSCVPHLLLLLSPRGGFSMAGKGGWKSGRDLLEVEVGVHI